MKRLGIAMFSVLAVLAVSAQGDYSVKSNHDACGRGSGDGFCSMPMTITLGSDVASFLITAEPWYNITPDYNYGSLLNGGQLLPAMFAPSMKNMVFPLAADQYGTNRWAMIILAVDAKNQLQNYELTTFFTPENDTDWHEYAIADFTDLMVSPSHSTPTPTYEVKVERKGSDGLKLRVVNPMAGNSEIADEYRSGHTTHNHYLYINADDPDYVYVEESPMGLNFGNGDVIASSSVGAAINKGQTADDLKAQGVAAGKLADDEITFPAGALHTFETADLDGATLSGAEGCLLKIKEIVGVETVVSSASASPATYYDLRGLRVAHPTPGQLYLRVSGDKATKVIIK